MRTTIRRAVAPVVAAFAAVALAACGGGGDADHAKVASAPDAKLGASASAGSDPAAWLDYARCLRHHGVAVKDPDLTPGKPIIAMADDSQVPYDSPGFATCQPKSPPDAPSKAEHVSAGDLAKLRAFAACIREHGVPAYPDPDPVTGSIPESAKAGFSTIKGDPHLQPAYTACQYLAPQTGTNG